MSDFVIQGFENFDIKPVRKRKAVSDTKMNAIKIFAAIFAILLLCELCVYFFVVPCLDKVEISWSGLSSYTKERRNFSMCRKKIHEFQYKRGKISPDVSSWH